MNGDTNGVHALGKQLEPGAEGQGGKPDQLVLELPSHLPPQLLNDGVERAPGDRLHVRQGVRRSPSLEHDVGGGEHLQDDADSVERLAVDHGLDCSDAAGGQAPPLIARYRSVETHPGGGFFAPEPLATELERASGVRVDATRKATNAEIAEWAERHDLTGSASDLRCAFEDAASLHLTTGAPPIDGGQSK